MLHLQRAVPELHWQRAFLSVYWEWSISHGCHWGRGKEEGKAACFGTGIKPTFTHQRYLRRACCSRFPPSITAQILLFHCCFLCSRRGHDSEPFLECWQALTVSLLAQHSCAVSLETWHRNALWGAAGRRQGMETVSWGFFPLLVPYPSKYVSNLLQSGVSGSESGWLLEQAHNCSMGRNRARVA